MIRIGVILCLLLAPLAAAFGADPPAPRILVTFADPGMSPAARAGPRRPGYVRRSGVYLVSVAVRRRARGIESEFGLDHVDEWPIDPLKVHCIVYRAPADADLDQLLARLRDDPRVESAQRVNRFELLGSGTGDAADPYRDLQHNFDSLELQAAHKLTRGRGSRVTIIDTGADVGHPDLSAQIDLHRDFVADDRRAFERDAHGTAIAGLIAASDDNGIGIAGVAPSALLSVLKACWYEDRQAAAVCDSFTLAKALSFAIDSPTDVINLSLGGPPDRLLTRLVEQALAAGKIVVAAAPAAMSEDAFPAAVDGVIVAEAAGASEATDGEHRPGPSDARVYAPAHDILVPVPGGGFDYASGNSLSAAQVSGIVALMVSMRASLTSSEANSHLAAGWRGVGAVVSACRALTTLLSELDCAADAAADNAAMTRDGMDRP